MMSYVSTKTPQNCLFITLTIWSDLNCRDCKILKMSKAACDRAKQLTGGKKLSTEEMLHVYKDWASRYDKV